MESRGIAWLIVSGMMLLAAPTATIGLHPVDSDESAPCAMAIEFVTPTDWRCVNNDSEACTVCRNVSDHSSELSVRRVDEGTAKRRQMPPGAELSVCSGKAAPVGSAL